MRIWCCKLQKAGNTHSFSLHMRSALSFIKLFYRILEKLCPPGDFQVPVQPCVPQQLFLRNFLRRAIHFRHGKAAVHILHRNVIAALRCVNQIVVFLCIAFGNCLQFSVTESLPGTRICRACRTAVLRCHRDVPGRFAVGFHTAVIHHNISCKVILRQDKSYPAVFRPRTTGGGGNTLLGYLLGLCRCDERPLGRLNARPVEINRNTRHQHSRHNAQRNHQRFFCSFRGISLFTAYFN